MDGLECGGGDPLRDAGYYSELDESTLDDGISGEGGCRSEAGESRSGDPVMLAGGHGRSECGTNLKRPCSCVICGRVQIRQYRTRAGTVDGGVTDP